MDEEYWKERYRASEMFFFWSARWSLVCLVSGLACMQAGWGAVSSNVILSVIWWMAVAVGWHTAHVMIMLYVMVDQLEYVGKTVWR